MLVIKASYITPIISSPPGAASGHASEGAVHAGGQGPALNHLSRRRHRRWRAVASTCGSMAGLWSCAAWRRRKRVRAAEAADKPSPRPPLVDRGGGGTGCRAAGRRCAAGAGIGVGCTRAAAAAGVAVLPSSRMHCGASNRSRPQPRRLLRRCVS
jgi:hypothetical protein